MKKTSALLSFAFIMLAGAARADCDSEYDCHGQCTHTARHSCIGTITDPFRTCETTYLDPACNLRCEAEKLACKNGITLGCNIWNGNPYYEQGRAAIYATGFATVDACLADVDAVASGATVVGGADMLYSTIAKAVPSVAQLFTGVAMSEIAKHGARCACKNAGLGMR